MSGTIYSYPFSIQPICSSVSFTFTTDSSISETGFRILISSVPQNTTLPPSIPITTLPHKNITILHQLLHTTQDTISHLEYIQTQLNDDIQELIHIHQRMQPSMTLPVRCTTKLFAHYSLTILVLTGISLLLSVSFTLNSIFLHRRLTSPSPSLYQAGKYAPTPSTATLLHSIKPISATNHTCVASHSFQNFLDTYYHIEHHGSLFTFLTRSMAEGLFQTLVLVFLTTHFLILFYLLYAHLFKEGRGPDTDAHSPENDENFKSHESQETVMIMKHPMRRTQSMITLALLSMHLLSTHSQSHLPITAGIFHPPPHMK